jgi:Alpha/beta hydrolase family
LIEADSPGAARFEVLGQRLEYRWIGPRPEDAPTIVFLHEGLGCLAMWRDFPDRMAFAAGCGALVYSRLGYGASEPVRGPRPVRFMHDEALDVLPAVIERFQLEEVILLGHSDGASIAVVYAGARFSPVRARWSSRRRTSSSNPFASKASRESPRRTRRHACESGSRGITAATPTRCFERGPTCG